MDMINIDTWLFFLINHGTVNGLFDVLMPVLSNKGYLLALPFGAYIIALALRQAPDKRREALHYAIWTIVIAVVSFLLADWITNEIKYVFQRTRPCNALEGVRMLGGCTQTYSMPSGHATNSFAYAIALFIMTRGHVRLSWRLYPIILAVLVAYSRPYLGVHYPSDITAGAIVGGLSAVSVIALFRYACRKYTIRPHATVFFGLLISMAIFRFYHILRGPLDLSPFEAFLWQFAGSSGTAIAPASPMTIWLISAGTTLFGNTVFGIRAVAATLSILSCYMMFRMVRDIYHDEAVALWASALLLLIPAFSLAGVMLSTDSALIFFWLLSLYLFYQAIRPEEDVIRNNKDRLLIWLCLGLTIGLGLLTSYMMAAFPVGMFIFLLMTDRKFLLETIGPYFSLVTGLLTIFIWIAANGWSWTAEVRLPDEAIRSIGTGLISVIWQQVLYITPIILALIFVALHKLFYKDMGLRSTYLFAFSIPVIMLAFCSSIILDGREGVSTAGYLTGLIALASFIFRADNMAGQTADKGKLRKAVFMAAAALAFFVTAISLFPNMMKLSANLDPVIELRGWRELGSEVSNMLRSNKANGPFLIISDSCRISAELAFYVSGRPTTYCVNSAGQYTALSGMKMDTERFRKEATLAAKTVNALIVTAGDRDMPETINRDCSRVEKQVLKVRHKGRELKAYSLFICYNFRAP